MRGISLDYSMYIRVLRTSLACWYDAYFHVLTVKTAGLIMEAVVSLPNPARHIQLDGIVPASSFYCHLPQAPKVLDIA